MIVFCQDKRRRDAVLRTPNLNGIDYLEVMGDPGCGKQLALTFLKDARALNLVADNVQLSGDTALEPHKHPARDKPGSVDADNRPRKDWRLLPLHARPGD